MNSKRLLIIFASATFLLLFIKEGTSKSNLNFYLKAGKLKSLDNLHSEAIEQFDQVLTIDPRNISALLNRGISRRKIEDNSGAISDFDKALEIKPRLPYALFQRALTKSKLKDLSGEILDYNRIIEINPIRSDLLGKKYINYSVNPVFADSFMNRGIAKSELGNIKDACNDWREASRLGVKSANSFIDKNCQ